MSTRGQRKSYAQPGSSRSAALDWRPLHSFEWFRTEGLRELFAEISPITSFNKSLELHFGGKKEFSVDTIYPGDLDDAKVSPALLGVFQEAKTALTAQASGCASRKKVESGGLSILATSTIFEKDRAGKTIDVFNDFRFDPPRTPRRRATNTTSPSRRRCG